MRRYFLAGIFFLLGLPMVAAQGQPGDSSAKLLDMSLSSLHESYQTLLKENQSLQSQLRLYQDNIDRTRRSLDNLLLKKSRLQGMPAPAGAATASAGGLATEIAGLREEISRLQGRLLVGSQTNPKEELKKQEEDLSKALQRAQKDIARSNALLKDLKKEHIQRSEEMKKLQQRQEVLTGKVVDLQKQLQSILNPAQAQTLAARKAYQEQYLTRLINQIVQMGLQKEDLEKQFKRALAATNIDSGRLEQAVPLYQRFLALEGDHARLLKQVNNLGQE